MTFSDRPSLVITDSLVSVVLSVVSVVLSISDVSVVLSISELSVVSFVVDQVWHSLALSYCHKSQFSTSQLRTVRFTNL